VRKLKSTVTGKSFQQFAEKLFSFVQIKRTGMGIAGHVLPTTEFDQDEQYDNHIESQIDNGKATKVRETPI